MHVQSKARLQSQAGDMSSQNTTGRYGRSVSLHTYRQEGGLRVPALVHVTAGEQVRLVTGVN